MSITSPAPVAASQQALALTRSRPRFNAIRRFARRQPLGVIALILLIIIAFMAIFAPWLRTTDPQAINTGAILHGPSWDHWFGTNRQGSDVWSRVLYGGRPSLIIGVTTVAIGLGGGTVLGLLAGYFRGWVDFVISRAAEFIVSFPPIIVGIVVAAAMKPGLRSVIIAITIVVMAATTRLIRGSVLQERTLVYVDAARTVGASEARIVFRHILPNISPLVVILASALLPTAILFESAVTFLGFGLPQGEPSWGADLSGQTRTFFSLAPWLAIFPGAALCIAILAFNLLGDALRDELDPRLRNL